MQLCIRQLLEKGSHQISVYSLFSWDKYKHSWQVINSQEHAIVLPDWLRRAGASLVTSPIHSVCIDYQVGAATAVTNQALLSITVNFNGTDPRLTDKLH
jgi:hypothetical protein